MLWIPITLMASLMQVLRNAAQASLTGKIGTLGATQVRFVFGLPFAALFFVAGLALLGESVPPVTGAAMLWALIGACSQIAATALMLVVMHRRAFGVAYAYIKTEPIIVAVAGVVLLGDHLPALAWLAVLIVTAGVIIASVPPGEFGRLLHERGMIGAGICAGGLFGLSAIAFRAAIEAVPQGSFVARSLEMLTIALSIQAAMLGAWLFFRDRQAFTGSLREWRASIGAGFLGALASAGWFCAFALTPAVNVRTLALIEMPLAAAMSGRLTGKSARRHEIAGLIVVACGLMLLLGVAASRHGP